MTLAKSPRVLIGLILILIGVIAGMLMTANFNLASFGKASAEDEARAKLEEKMSTMMDFSEGFSAVAEYVTPSVVTVETEKVVRVSNYDPFQGFFGDDFFNRFFGGPRVGPQQEQQVRGLGSGVIVSSDGYILTNNHVIDDVDKVTITLSNGKSYEGKLIGRDARTDLAVVKIDEQKLPAIKMANSDDIRVGQWAIAIGSPFSKALSQTVTAGIISGLGRSAGLDTDVDFLQTDAAINPGNSGGALVNLKGELLGINTAIVTRSGGYQGIGFAIPSNTAKNILDQITKTGKVSRGYLGVVIQDVSDDVARALKLASSKGALISQIVDGSPADKAKLKAGDVIIKVNGKEIENTSSLRKNIGRNAPGTKITLTILRDGSEREITLTLDEAPSEPIEQKEEQPSRQGSERLGVEVAKLTADLANKYGLSPGEKGVIILQISQNGAAYQGGLRAGDLIKRIGNREITSIQDYNDALAAVGKGETALFYINRRGTLLFVAFNLN
jgi:serine protease Do